MDERFGQVLEAVYACVTAPQAWPGALAAICDLFRCHFGDAFARTVDFATYRGVAHGLDPGDYQHGLLDTWVKRNVWSAVHPVREAGHIVTTREMMDPATLRRSEMYLDYLAPRDLHEGLRFDLWAGDGWVQDISLLRAWSAGPFTEGERATARMLLPHLQRATAVARRLSEAEATATAGFEATDALRQSVFLTDNQARVLRANAAGARMLSDGTMLSGRNAVLAGPTPAATARLHATVARAAAHNRDSGHLRIHGPHAHVNVVAIPVPAGRGWTDLRGPAVLLMAGTPRDPVLPAASHLARLFDLTAAEAAVARRLMAGRTVNQIAAETRRSVNTVRTHVARLMAKTGTHRQGALVRLLLGAPPEHPGPGPGFR